MPFTSACVTKTESEAKDKEWDIFIRRMQLRHYFQDLRRSIARRFMSKGASTPNVEKMEKSEKKKVP